MDARTHPHIVAFWHSFWSIILVPILVEYYGFQGKISQATNKSLTLITLSGLADDNAIN